MDNMHEIARIYTDFPTKFGIPRQSGLVEALEARIVFAPEYRDPNALRGIEGYSHIWLIWKFSAAVREGWSPTVRPPRLGGEVRMGVFATRSPFRPNPIGLSSVRLLGVDYAAPDGPALRVAGADLMNGTPIYDIKPYIYADCHPDATDGFAGDVRGYALEVDFPEALLQAIPESKRAALFGILAQDPRPGYRHADDGRRFGVEFAGFDVRFTVKEGVLHVCDVEKTPKRST